MTTLAEVTRGDLVESTHAGAVAVADAAGHMVAWAGDVDRVIYFRSAAKPFQAIPLVESGAAAAFGFSEQELALACASHDATPAHQRGVAQMLAKIGLDEDDLRCGITPPADEQEAARITLGLKSPSQVQCECSGEHVGMLAACRHLGYPLGSYIADDHPLQRRILKIIAIVLGVSENDVAIGTDGCSLPTFGAPLQRVASAYACLAAPERAAVAADGSLTDPLNRLRQAMLAHPVMVGNEGGLDTDIMRFSGGRIVAKLGAEGLLCMAVPERGLGSASPVTTVCLADSARPRSPHSSNSVLPMMPSWARCANGMQPPSRASRESLLAPSGRRSHCSSGCDLKTLLPGRVRGQPQETKRPTQQGAERAAAGARQGKRLRQGITSIGVQEARPSVENRMGGSDVHTSILTRFLSREGAPRRSLFDTLPSMNWTLTTPLLLIGGVALASLFPGAPVGLPPPRMVDIVITTLATVETCWLTWMEFGLIERCYPPRLPRCQQAGVLQEPRTSQRARAG